MLADGITIGLISLSAIIGQTNKAKQKFLFSSSKQSQAAVPGWTL